eukprot:CAMPEP_0115828600 /NCGR_PEP_ID=MMETSP0287-20121206/658_1 /TAXON_ID=412157 /ORGANISM="Chrysochromulina rotalis, Strain UIO044" /LENGTH=440 /DNA_ID=CAMNT_0003281823 /DNA_START=13 /DNA_END=1334 /DNA_ORIENTATION=+
MGDEEGGAPEWVVQTQQTLGELIKRPKLTDALLQKPPFRFLHDVVSEVTKVTNFGSGLYQEDELNSGKIKDKESKLAYLSKIIKCVELSLGITIPVRVGKVVAGLEAENTNMFLQYLYQALIRRVAVSQVLAEAPQPESRESRAPPPPPPPASEPFSADPAPSAQPLAEAAAEQGLQQMTSAPMKPRDEDVAAAEEQSSKRVRPKSARRPPPKISSNEVKVGKPGAQEAAPSVAAGVILEGEGAHEEESTIEMVDNTGEAVDTRSMLSEAGGQNHGRLVRNLLDAKEEMEQKGEDKEKPTDGEADGERGGGIILGKKSKPGAAGGGGKLPSKTEVNSLRASIQTLCQSSNPLGRCLEYVQEDLEAMGKELESWRAQRHRRAGELADEEATTASALVGLKSELEQVEEKIREKQAQIRFAKASILRNDAQVERLLSQVVRA